MDITIGDLRQELARADGSHAILVAANGSFVPVIGVVVAPGSGMVVLRTRGKTNTAKRFTVGEDGIIGHLAHLGVSDEHIGEVLGRPAKSVAKRRADIGFGTPRNPS